MRKEIVACLALASAFCAFADAPKVFRVNPNDSLTEMRDKIRALRKSGEIKPSTPVEVVLSSGTYMLNDSFELTNEDSGTKDAPTVWKSEKPLEAKLFNGLKLSADNFKKITNPKVLDRIPSEARDKVLVADLSKLVKEDFPAMDDKFSTDPSAPHLYIDHMPATIARWPNAGWISFTNVVDTGFDPESNTRHPAAFAIKEERVKRWNIEEGVWVNGYLAHDWANESVRLGSITATNDNFKVLRLAVATWYGVHCNSWGCSARRFYVFNLLDELDAPGEWYLDRKNKLLYVYPPANKDFSKIEIVLATKSKPQVVSDKKGLSNFSFEDITFEYSAGNGLVFNGVTNVTLRNCRISNMARVGVEISGMLNRIENCEIVGMGHGGVIMTGGNRKNLINSESVIEGCEIHDFGRYQRTYAGGIRINGCGITVRKNRIHNAPHTAVFFWGNEHLIEFNEVYNVLLETADAGAYYTGRDWTSQGNVLRYNFTHHLGNIGAAEEGKDEDPLTMGFYFDDCDCGDLVYGNIFWKLARGIMIGGGRDIPVRNNIFADCKMGLSMDSRALNWASFRWNNSVISAKNPDLSWDLKAKAEAVNYQEEPWKSRYPNLANTLNESPREPLHNDLENNIFLNCEKEIFFVDPETTNFVHKLVIKNNLVINTVASQDPTLPKINPIIAFGFECKKGTAEKPFDPGFVDYENGDFRIKKYGFIEKNMKSFREIPAWGALLKPQVIKE